MAGTSPELSGNAWNELKIFARQLVEIQAFLRAPESDSPSFTLLHRWSHFLRTKILESNYWRAILTRSELWIVL